MDTPEKCVFCRTRDADSYEDAWPSWLYREFQEGGTHHLRNESLRGGTADAEVLRKWHGKFRVAGFCRKCNNEWMSRLENKVKQVLLPMMRGQERELSPVDQKTLARWAYMKTLVFAAGTPGAIVGDQEFVKFFLKKKPPHRSITLLTACDERYPGGVFRFDPLTLNYGPGSSREAFRVTFVIGHVVIQVFPERPVGKNVAPVVVRQSDDLLLRIWPVDRRGCVWPPPKVLNRKGIQELLDYFYDAHRREGNS